MDCIFVLFILMYFDITYVDMKFMYVYMYAVVATWNNLDKPAI